MTLGCVTENTMAARCEFIDVIIPIANIDRVFPGEFTAYKTENAGWIEFDRGRQCVYLKGQAPDPVIGREHFTRPDRSSTPSSSQSS